MTGAARDDASVIMQRRLLLRDGRRSPWRPARTCSRHSVSLGFHDDRDGGRELVW